MLLYYDEFLLPRLALSSPARFDHLVHYGGSYYCYLFNRVRAFSATSPSELLAVHAEWQTEALAAHVWRQSFQADPFNRETGVRLRGRTAGLLPNKGDEKRWMVSFFISVFYT